MAPLPYSRLVADLGLSDGHRMMIEAVPPGARVLDVGCAGGYVLFVAATDRTLSPLRGRLAGLRDWRRYRRAGAATRGPAPLAAPTGPLGAWRQRAAYRSDGPRLP